MSSAFDKTPGVSSLANLLSGQNNVSGLPAPTLLGSGLVQPLSPFPFCQPIPGAQLLGLVKQEPTPMWVYVRRRFTQLLGNLNITVGQRQDGDTKQGGVRACLNRHYWNEQSITAHSFLIGSWGKRTQVRPSRDVDILFLLPNEVYHQYQARQGNRQSQLLQEVRGVLAVTYPATTMRADGQVIVIPFNQTPVELSPGFLCADGSSIIVCDAHDEGSYKLSTAIAEAQELEAHDKKWNGNVRALARMMKRWQKERNVPLKSFQLERLAIEFLSQWPNSHHDVFWYDWMVRDFLAFLIGRTNTWIVMPGTGEQVWLGNDWLSRARTAYGFAISACDNERDNYETLAGRDWQELFGAAVNISV